METSKLKEILEQHKLWLDGKGRKRANLCGANLEGAYLAGADLRGADLRGANLTDANLNCASLYRANLEYANLNDADLTGANLQGATLTGATLTGANLNHANLTYANLEGAILPDISWIIPGCLVQLNKNHYAFYLEKEGKYDNFVQDSLGFFIQDNVEEKTFDMLAGDRIIRNIPDWLKYTGLRQIASESV